MKAVVCGRNFTSRLGMIRALGECGYDIILVRTNKGHDVDSYSRYVVKDMFSSERNEGALLQTLLSLSSESEGKMLLMPVDDYCAAVIDQNLDVLKDKYLFQNIDMTQGELVRLMDKELQKSLAVEAGMNVASGCRVKIEDGTYSVPEGVRYPCFTKPLASFKEGKSFMRKCSSEKELRTVLDSAASARKSCEIMVEDFVQIEKELAIVGISDGAKVVIPGVIQMLLDGIMYVEGAATHTGVTCLGKVCPPGQYKDFLSRIEDMVKELHYVGLFDVDAYVADGRLFFNELNLRFGASGYSMTASGINLPKMLADTLRSGSAKADCVALDHEVQFVSEKALLELWGHKGIGWREYMNYVWKSQVRFIYNKADIVPFLLYQYKIVKAWFKRIR